MNRRTDQVTGPTGEMLNEVRSDQITYDLVMRLAKVFTADLINEYQPGTACDQITAKAATVTALATMALALQDG